MPDLSDYRGQPKFTAVRTERGTWEWMLYECAPYSKEEVLWGGECDTLEECASFAVKDLAEEEA